MSFSVVTTTTHKYGWTRKKTVKVEVECSRERNVADGEDLVGGLGKSYLYISAAQTQRPSRDVPSGGSVRLLRYTRTSRCLAVLRIDAHQPRLRLTEGDLPRWARRDPILGGIWSAGVEAQQHGG